VSEHTTSDTERAIHPLERLKQQAEEARKKREKERVHCPECDTTVWKDDMEGAVETAEQHDEQRHGGEAITKINGIVPPQFSEEEKDQIRDAVESLQTGSDRSTEGADDG